jgi:hypothetical protein
MKIYKLNFALFILLFSSLGLTKKLEPFLDEQVSGILIHSPTSVEKVLGDKAWKQVKSQVSPQSKAQFLNKNGQQKITLVFHPGGEKNSFSEILVEKVKNKENLESIAIDDFISSKKIKLGVNESEVLAKLGKAHKFSKMMKKRILIYTLTDPDHPFLKKHKMPAYRAQYEFLQGELIKYSFGFEYP